MVAVQSVTATDEQIAFYQANGFVQFENVLTPDEVATFRAALAEATARPGDGYFFNKGAQYTQHVNVWTTGEAMRRLVFNPTLAGIARQLSRSAEVRLWHDQEIIKMPGDRPSAWHQDLTVWPMLEAGPLTCWLALVDVPVEMGCMSFLPGSQRWGRLATASLSHEALESLDGVRLLVPDDKRDKLQPVTVPVTAGSCTFHNSLTLHYAGPNLTDRPREGFIINYLPDTIHYSGRRHVTTDPLQLAPGAPLAGDLFPVLASVKSVA
ncbi:MAG TPA: phytanoyl-CoA dioxygenase family protein [Chloroflexota bacterium]|jgi:ectoine hydroxylase-related dioxygenase (phytanoyl-CoA dioxygenase family)|nr:phytanoyl-CoA dioxygenase family protein [Chloroflexota bacterium]